MSFLFFLTIYFILHDIVYSLNQVNFTSGSGYILSAFGDFNSDQKTDIFMISDDCKSFRILLQGKYDSDELSIESFPDNRVVNCDSEETIVALIPGDFHGETFLDVAVVTKKDNDIYNIRLVRGSRSNVIDCEPLKKSPLITSQVMPAMLDFNGDMICDLLTYNETHKAIIHYGGLGDPFSKSKQLTFITEKMSDKYSSAFVDVNDDGVADLVYATDKEFYYYHSLLTKFDENPSKKIDFPKDCKNIGQSLFIDIFGTGKLTHVLPANCKGQAQLFFYDDKHDEWNSSLTNNLADEDKKLCFAHLHHKKLRLPIALRAGDYNLDGLPELVGSFKRCDDNAGNEFLGILESEKDEKLRFSLGPKYNLPGSHFVGSFLDLSENGRLDLIYTNEYNGKLYLGAIGDFERDDTNFLKIMLGSGLCPINGCRSSAFSKERINYGSNLPGARFRYFLKDTNDKTKISVASQLTCSSHFALQTPYIVFGLGKYVNYVDNIEVSIPYNHINFTTKVRRHTIEQTVPDAQILIIPRPPNKPNKWLERLYLTPGTRIISTLYTLLGICAILSIVIYVLHRKEKQEDATENAEFRQIWFDRR